MILGCLAIVFFICVVAIGIEFLAFFFRNFFAFVGIFIIVSIIASLFRG